MQRNASIMLLLLLFVGNATRGGWTQATVTPRPSRQAAAAVPPRWWPRYVRPKSVLLVVRPQSQEEYMTLMTLAGLVARAAQQGRTDQMIWVKQTTPNAYDLWLPAMLKQTGATQRGPFTVRELLQRFAKAGIVKGYLLYHPDTSKRDAHQGIPNDTSVNVATSLCAPMEGVAIADTLTAKFEEMHLKQLFDARGVSEADCFERYQKLFSRDLVALQDPKVPEVRDAAVAAQAFVLCRPDALYEKVLAWAKEGAPVLGWGIGDEFDITSRATRHGHFITATDWCYDLPLLSTETPGGTFNAAALRNPHPRTLWDLNWEDDVHYTTFIMSDGDNVQWAMGDFTRSTEQSWWDSRYRGSVNLGWTCCYDNLVQLSPYTAAYLFRTATESDDFVLFGGGYFYPDLFGTSHPNSDVLAQHTAQFAAYMRLGGLKLLMFNAQQWDAQASVRAYGTFAKAVPDLAGIFAISYAPYTAGRGNTFWVPGGQDGQTPVVSLRYALWNHASDPSQGDPVKIAGLLNGMPHTGKIESDRCFSTVMIHAWSWFQAPHDGEPAGEVDQAKGGSPGTGRGACVAKWCGDLLQPHVRVLLPSDYMQMMRLRLHPQETLQSQLAALSAQLKAAAAAGGDKSAHRSLLQQAQTELSAAQQSWKRGDFRKAFVHGKRGHTLLAQAAQL